MTKIVVGYDGSDQGRDALTFGRELAGVTGADVLAVCAHAAPLAPSLGPDAVMREGHSHAERVLGEVEGDVECVPVQSDSPAIGLARVAEAEGAELIVAGASHRGPLGEALLGTVGRSLLHGAPCAVAVAPRGYASAAAPGGAVGVAFDGSPESAVALAEGVRMARAAGAALHVVSVLHSGELFPDTRWIIGDREYANLRHERRRQQLDEALAELPQDVEASGELLIGEPDNVLKRTAAKRQMRMLITGSRGYGAFRRTALGSTASALIHSAPCPVIVCPRGARAQGSEADGAAAGAEAR